MNQTELADRLAAIEADLAALKAKIHPRPVHALERIHGTFEDDAAFREAARLGRQAALASMDEADRKAAVKARRQRGAIPLAAIKAELAAAPRKRRGR